MPFVIPEKDRSRVLLQDSKQKLIINPTIQGDAGPYECRTTNRLGPCNAEFQLNFNGRQLSNNLYSN